jgi:hypothetical protein
MADVGGPQNQSFLATVNATVTPAYIEGDVKSVLDWFARSLTLIDPASSFNSLGTFLADNEDIRCFASEFLRASSTGVDDLLVLRRSLSEEALFGLFPEALATDVRDDLAAESTKAVIVHGPDGSELAIQRAGPETYHAVTVEAAHEHGSGGTVALNLADESDGTRRLLDLLPALYRLKTNKSTFIIDEIDRSMHPMLVWEILSFFLTSTYNSRSQMIVTTHESNLLDLGLLRRDEIWFAEKDAQASTHLYSLSDFNVRKDLEVRKHYFQGRFGAVPFLGDLKRLVANEAAS